MAVLFFFVGWKLLFSLRHCKRDILFVYFGLVMFDVFHAISWKCAEPPFLPLFLLSCWKWVSVYAVKLFSLVPISDYAENAIRVFQFFFLCQFDAVQLMALRTHFTSHHAFMYITIWRCGASAWWHTCSQHFQYYNKLIISDVANKLNALSNYLPCQT